MPGLVERPSGLSQWTISIIVILIIVTLLWYIRRRRRLYGGSGTHYHPPVYISSSTKTYPDIGSSDSWLQRVMEWMWSRRHVTWRHVASCGVDAWMTALTDQASRQSVRARTGGVISEDSRNPIFGVQIFRVGRKCGI